MLASVAPEIEPVVDWRQVGEQFLGYVAARDFDALATCFHPQVRSRLLVTAGLMTPVDGPAITDKFRQWFGDTDRLVIERSEVTLVGDRLHVGYTIRCREDGEWFAVEQHTYSRLEERSIVAFDLICSGFRPAEAGDDIEGGDS